MTATHKILAIDALHQSIHALMQPLPVEFHYLPNLNLSQILALIPQYDGLILRSKINIDAHFLEVASQLKWIARAGSGLDTIDTLETQKRNITVLNAPEANRDAVAEHTIGLLLALFRKTLCAHQQVRQSIWNREQNRGYELKGKTVGIVGYGNVGTQVARRLSAFDCEVMVYDLKPKKDQIPNKRQVDMNTIFAHADVLTLHVPLTSLTQGMVGEEYLDKFTKNIWLVNTSRGEILKLDSLCNAIQQGKVIGAALDVLENEKIDQLTALQQQNFDFLRQQDNVILTPHIAGWTFESYERINEVLVKKIQDLIGT
jgi:D-3-phosphoglycerate dehydrogenase / 2-oxoglutarate reductase